MARIFLSYARVDRATAEKLAAVLTGHGHVVWWDRHLDGGEQFADEIEAELEAADIVLVAWSKQSIKSRWVRDEAAVGGDSGRLVPVSLDGGLPPIGFRQFHTLDLSRWNGGKRDPRTADLLHAIERRLTGKKAPPAATDGSTRTAKPRRLPALAALALLATAAAVYLTIGRQASSRGTPPTIALLPITTAGVGGDLGDLASQTRDSISDMLSRGSLLVRRLDIAPNEPDKISDYRISGELSRRGNLVVATVRLDESTRGVAVFARRFEASGEDIKILPERVGAQIAGSIGWAASMLAIEKNHPSDPEVLTDLLRQLDFTGDRLTTYQNVRRAAARGQKSAFAQISLALHTTLILGELPRQERPAAVAAALKAADKAIKLAPEFGDTYAAWCYLHSEVYRVECEDRLVAAKKIDPQAPFLNQFYSHLLRQVGRLDEAAETMRLAYTLDPYVPTKISAMLRMLEYRGEREEAEKLAANGARWWPEHEPAMFRDRAIGLLARGDLKAIGALEKRASEAGKKSASASSAALISALDSRSVPRLRRVCAAEADFWMDIRCMIAFSKIGDLDGAYAIADRLYPKRIGRTPAETERIWLDQPIVALQELISSPATAPMRRDPRFRVIAQRLGLWNYWRSGRLPDFCRKQAEPVCAELRST